MPEVNSVSLNTMLYYILALSKSQTHPSAKTSPQATTASQTQGGHIWNLRHQLGGVPGGSPAEMLARIPENSRISPVKMVSFARGYIAVHLDADVFQVIDDKRLRKWLQPKPPSVSRRRKTQSNAHELAAFMEQPGLAEENEIRQIFQRFLGQFINEMDSNIALPHMVNAVAIGMVKHKPRAIQLFAVLTNFVRLEQLITNLTNDVFFAKATAKTVKDFISNIQIQGELAGNKMLFPEGIRQFWHLYITNLYLAYRADPKNATNIDALFAACGAIAPPGMVKHYSMGDDIAEQRIHRTVHTEYGNVAFAAYVGYLKQVLKHVGVSDQQKKILKQTLLDIFHTCIPKDIRSRTAEDSNNLSLPVTALLTVFQLLEIINELESGNINNFLEDYVQQFLLYLPSILNHDGNMGKFFGTFEWDQGQQKITFLPNPNVGVIKPDQVFGPDIESSISNARFSFSAYFSRIMPYIETLYQLSCQLPSDSLAKHQIEGFFNIFHQNTENIWLLSAIHLSVPSEQQWAELRSTSFPASLGSGFRDFAALSSAWTQGSTTLQARDYHTNSQHPQELKKLAVRTLIFIKSFTGVPSADAILLVLKALNQITQALVSALSDQEIELLCRTVHRLSTLQPDEEAIQEQKDSFVSKIFLRIVPTESPSATFASSSTLAVQASSSMLQSLTDTILWWWNGPTTESFSPATVVEQASHSHQKTRVIHKPNIAEKPTGQDSRLNVSMTEVHEFSQQEAYSSQRIVLSIVFQLIRFRQLQLESVNTERKAQQYRKEIRRAGQSFLTILLELDVDMCSTHGSYLHADLHDLVMTVIFSKHGYFQQQVVFLNEQLQSVRTFDKLCGVGKSISELTEQITKLCAYFHLNDPDVVESIRSSFQGLITALFDKASDKLPQSHYKSSNADFANALIAAEKSQKKIEQMTLIYCLLLKTATGMPIDLRAQYTASIIEGFERLQRPIFDFAIQQLATQTGLDERQQGQLHQLLQKNKCSIDDKGMAQILLAFRQCQDKPVLCDRLVRLRVPREILRALILLMTNEETHPTLQALKPGELTNLYKFFLISFQRAHIASASHNTGVEKLSVSGASTIDPESYIFLRNKLDPSSDIVPVSMTIGIMDKFSSPQAILAYYIKRLMAPSLLLGELRGIDHRIIQYLSSKQFTPNLSADFARYACSQLLRRILSSHLQEQTQEQTQKQTSYINIAVNLLLLTEPLHSFSQIIQWISHLKPDPENQQEAFTLATNIISQYLQRLVILVAERKIVLKSGICDQFQKSLRELPQYQVANSANTDPSKASAVISKNLENRKILSFINQSLHDLEKLTVLSEVYTLLKQHLIYPETQKNASLLLVYLEHYIKKPADEQNKTSIRKLVSSTNISSLPVAVDRVFALALEPHKAQSRHRSTHSAHWQARPRNSTRTDVGCASHAPPSQSGR